MTAHQFNVRIEELRFVLVDGDEEPAERREQRQRRPEADVRADVAEMCDRLLCIFTAHENVSLLFKYMKTKTVIWGYSLN